MSATRRSLLASLLALPLLSACVVNFAPKRGRRISVDKNDPGFMNYVLANHAGKVHHVFLDGKEVQCCFTADESLGYVKHAELDEHGKLFLRFDAVAAIESYGVVSILVAPP